jgi:hypothetical protein
VDELGRVQVFQSFGQLIDDVAGVDVLQDPLPDHIVQIGLHKLENQIDVFVVLGPDHRVEFDYVGVVHLVQQRDLAEGALGVSRMLERIEYLFEGNDCLGLSVDGLPDVSVGSTAHLLHELESFDDMFFHLFAHFLFFINSLPEIL